MATNLDSSTQSTGFVPNILDNYYSYTYNISLRLYNNDVLKEQRLPTITDRYVTIAETGVTGQFYIKSLEADSVVGTLDVTRGMASSKITMELDEPLGFSFIDRILQAGMDLGLPNLNSAPYVITITFTGWDASGGTGSPIGTPKQYLCTLTSVIPDFSKKGTSYKLIFVPNNDLPQQNKKLEIPKMTFFNKADTLDQTLKNFAAALNKVFDVSSEQTIQTISGNKDDPNRYRLNFNFALQNSDTLHGNIKLWTMDKNKQQGGDQSFSVTDPSNNTVSSRITVQPGQHVIDVLTSIIGSTNEAYIFTCPASTPQTAKLIPDEFPGYFCYETSYSVDRFDPNTGAYVENITITIIPKSMPSNSYITSQPGDSITVNKMIGSNLLVKGYEYIYTGENTSILDLKIDFSALWTDCLGLFTGALKDRSATIIPSASQTPITDTAPTLSAVNKSTVSQSTNQPSSFQINATKLDTPPSQAHYLEDYSTMMSATSLESFAKQEPTRDYSRAEQVVRGTSPVSSSSSNGKISIFGYMSDMSHSVRSTNMTTVSMTIRGDPFWLGITPQEANTTYSGKDYSDIKNSQTNYAVYQSGQQNVYLKFRSPQGLDQNTGLVTVSDSSAFNRVYFINTVKHTFSGGTFKQELEMVINRSIPQQVAQDNLNPMLNNTAPSLGPNTNSVLSIPNTANDIFKNTLSTNPNISLSGISALPVNSITNPATTVIGSTTVPTVNGIPVFQTNQLNRLI